MPATDGVQRPVRVLHLTVVLSTIATLLTPLGWAPYALAQDPPLPMQSDVSPTPTPPPPATIEATVLGDAPLVPGDRARVGVHVEANAPLRDLALRVVLPPGISPADTAIAPWAESSPR
jgi:hypothetical protein